MLKSEDAEQLSCSSLLPAVDVLAQCPSEVRHGFLRRVYTLLSLQLLLTTSACAAALCVPSATRVLLASPDAASSYASLGGLVCLLILSCAASRFPFNLALLLTFTLCESYSLARLCAQYAAHGAGATIVAAFGLTVVLFVGLSAYMHVARVDFEWLSTSLLMGTFALLGMGLFGLVVPVTLGHIFLASGGVALFCGYVLYDTSAMLTRFTPDDTVVAVVSLYLDIINLFLCLLNLLPPMRD